MSGNTFTLQNIDRVNFYGTDNGADVYLEGVSTGTSGVCVSGSLLVTGNGFMNFGNTLGAGGYGLHNDSGTIQFKHSGGDWTSITEASVSGSDTQIQFNDNGSFGACAGFTFDNSNNSFSVGANNNTVSGSNAGNVAGNNNSVTGSNAGNVAGSNNTVSGSNEGNVAGSNNTVSGSNAGNVAGNNNSVTGINTGNIAGNNNSVEGIRSGNVAGVNNIVNNSNSGNLAGNNNRVSGNQSGNIAGSDNGVSGNYAGNIAGEDNTIATGADYSVIAGGVSNQAYTDMVFVAGGFNNSVSGTSSTAIAGKDNTVSGTNAGNVAGESNNVFSNNTVTLGGEGLSTQTGVSWEKMALAGTYNNYSTYPWDESETQAVPGTCYRFLVGSGDSTTGNNAFAVDDVGNLYFGTSAGACIYQRTGLNTYEPINLGGGGGGGGGGTPNGNDTDIQFNDGGSFGGVSSLQFHKSTTSGVSALTVAGNVFSSMGVSDVTSQEPTSTYYQLTTSEYVNGVVFLPYQATGEEQFYQVRVPSATSVSTDFGDVLKPGQFFDTILYGTSLGVSQTTLTIGPSVFNTTTYYPADITVLSSSDNTNIFDTRLIRDRSGFTGQGLSFHFSELGLEYYQGVVIRSRYNSSAGISMYPISNSFYTF